MTISLHTVPNFVNPVGIFLASSLSSSFSLKYSQHVNSCCIKRSRGGGVRGAAEVVAVVVPLSTVSAAAAGIVVVDFKSIMEKNRAT
jgi:hypothetical protein